MLATLPTRRCVQQGPYCSCLTDLLTPFPCSSLCRKQGRAADITNAVDRQKVLGEVDMVFNGQLHILGG